MDRAGDLAAGRSLASRQAMRGDGTGTRAAEVQYVKVQEGWVVTSWGSADVERVLREGTGDGLEGGTAEPIIPKVGEKKKRKVVAKPQQAPKVESHVTSENKDESASEDEDDEEVDEYMDPSSPPKGLEGGGEHNVGF
jgi:hypothetical protein